MKHLILFMRLFGFKSGLILALQFKFNRHGSLKLPNIKYPFALRKNTSDKATFFQVFVKRQYGMHYPASPLFIIDGGANIGLFTIFIKNKYPAATVVCVEPDNDNFVALSGNVKNYSNVYLEQAGLWDKQIQLNVNDSASKSAVTVSEQQGDTVATGNVHSITINDILDKYKVDRIDILKLDIETSEKALFASNYENWIKKTKMIVIELHDWIEPASSNNFFRAITASLDNFSFSQRGENVVITNNSI